MLSLLQHSSDWKACIKRGAGGDTEATRKGRHQTNRGEGNGSGCRARKNQSRRLHENGKRAALGALKSSDEGKKSVIPWYQGQGRNCRRKAFLAKGGYIARQRGREVKWGG